MGIGVIFYENLHLGGMSTIWGRRVDGLNSMWGVKNL